MEITGLVDRYKKNLDQWRELEDKISGQYDMIAWTQFLGERSKKITSHLRRKRRYYTENTRSDGTKAGGKKRSADV